MAWEGHVDVQPLLRQHLLPTQLPENTISSTVLPAYQAFEQLHYAWTIQVKSVGHMCMWRHICPAMHLTSVGGGTGVLVVDTAVEGDDPTPSRM